MVLQRPDQVWIGWPVFDSSSSSSLASSAVERQRSHYRWEPEYKGCSSKAAAVSEHKTREQAVKPHTMAPSPYHTRRAVPTLNLLSSPFTKTVITLGFGCWLFENPTVNRVRGATVRRNVTLAHVHAHQRAKNKSGSILAADTNLMTLFLNEVQTSYLLFSIWHMQLNWQLNQTKCQGITICWFMVQPCTFVRFPMTLTGKKK